MKKTYIFKGNASIEEETWEQWICDSSKISELMQLKFNFYNISTEDSEIDKCRPIGGLKRKINNAKNNRKRITSMTFYFVPKDFQTIISDTIVELGRHEKYVYLTVNTAHLNILFKENDMLDILRRNINVENGEIFEMDKKEFPYYHIIGKDEKCKSLKIIEILD